MRIFAHAGWEVDTPTLRYSAGVRPAKGRNMAIAEWPTKSGPADYALFVGTRCIAVVEAKRQNKNVSAFIDQAQRYARGFQFAGGAEPIGGPWIENAEHSFLVPFVFSANGRPYLKQIETQSGIWFRDARKPSNPSPRRSSIGQRRTAFRACSRSMPRWRKRI